MAKSKCILISLDDDVSELEALAGSLDFKVEKVFVQHREKPNPKYYVGGGKVKEIKDFVEKHEIETVIFNKSLRPSQQYNLESFLGITVYDRIRLILEIFRDRAHSEEARLQVELAKLQYEIPLLRDWIHKARYGEKPGFMAGGEYEVAQYYEISRRRIKKNKQRLKKIEKEREIRRKQRHNLGYYLVCIVGYTNAGKSTLFNLISGDSVAVENRLFTTLSTTTRKIPDLKKQILITDTVGLIDNLPHWIIDAFHSTLEEIFLSDKILLILDISEPVTEIKRKLKASFDVLLPDLNPSNIILVLNKIDKIMDQSSSLVEKNAEHVKNNEKVIGILKDINVEHEVGDIVFISAKEARFKENVIKSILDTFEYPKFLSVLLPNTSNSQTFINWLYVKCEILTIEYENKVKIMLRFRERDEDHIYKTCLRLNGRIL
ncbi:MAG: GTPase HflX [Thermoplasmata archaeon]